jgi:hypothetical protein
MVGELLAASPLLPRAFGLDQFCENMRSLRRCRQFHHVIGRRDIRAWMNAGSAPRMDSLVLLSLHPNTSMLRLLTERIAVEAPIIRQNPHAHFRVEGPAVENALQAALRENTPPSLEEIAARLGYRSIAPLQFRFHDLCQEIIRRRRVHRKPYTAPVNIPLPRERIEQALSGALNKDSPTSLSSLAATIGLRNKRRLYKGFHDLRKAVVANNRRLRQQRAAAIESALRAGLTETPAPSVTAIARRFGFNTVTALTRRFPDLCAQLKRRRRQAALDNGLHRSNPSHLRPFRRPRRSAVFEILANRSNSPQ